MNAPLSLPWRELYQSRYTSDARWTSSASQTRHLTGHTDSLYCLEFFDAHSRTANWVDSITGETLEDPSGPPPLVSDADNGLIAALTRTRTTDWRDPIAGKALEDPSGPRPLVCDTDIRTANWVDSIYRARGTLRAEPPSLVNNSDNGLSSQTSDAESNHSLRPA
jgi:hypothetical protein